MPLWTLIYGEKVVDDVDLIYIFDMFSDSDAVHFEVDYTRRRISVKKVSNNFERSARIKDGIRTMLRNKFERYEGYIDDVNYKFCTSCKTSKELDHFGMRSDSTDGRARRCKECVSRKARSRRRKKKQNNDKPGHE